MTTRRIADHDIWTLEEGEGPEIRLFIHCSLARCDTLRPLNAMLPPARAIFFDLPGHGRSEDWNGEGDYQALVVDICEGLLQDTTGPLHVIGHSFGSTAALHLALRGSVQIDRLTLIDSVFFAAASAEAQAAYALRSQPFTNAMSRGDHYAAAEIFLDSWGAPGTWGELPEEKRQRKAEQMSLIMAAQPAMAQDCHNQLAPGRLEALTMPIDIFEGAKSEPIVHAINDGYQARFQNCFRMRVPEAGHMVPLTHTKAVVDGLNRVG